VLSYDGDKSVFEGRGMPIKKEIAHVHADCIKAWADGYAIEYRPNQGTRWQEVDDRPAWRPEFEYRIKESRGPETVKQHVFYSTHLKQVLANTDYPPNVVYIFDEAGKLIGVDMFHE
jgi:hypothetical protein